jgi:hypothetical protein
MKGEANMIKIKLLAALAAGALAFPALAQTQAPGLDKRQASPEARAPQGTQAGQLTAKTKKGTTKVAAKAQDRKGPRSAKEKPGKQVAPAR